MSSEERPRATGRRLTHGVTVDHEFSCRARHWEDVAQFERKLIGYKYSKKTLE